MGRAQRGVKGIVIEAARDIFARYGFRKTTMEEIAQAAHLAKSSLYHYFRSKEEIFAAILDHEFQTSMDEVAQAVKAESKHSEKLRIYFRYRLLAMQKATSFYSAVLDEYFEFYPEIERMRRDIDAWEMKTVADILRQGIAEGEFSLVDLDAAQIGLRAVLRGVEFYCIAVEKNFDKIEQIQDLLLNTFFYGILKR